MLDQVQSNRNRKEGKKGWKEGSQYLYGSLYESKPKIIFRFHFHCYSRKFLEIIFRL
jgi:hypothetical protein